MPETPSRPLPGDSPRRTLDERLAAARTSQAQKRRRVAGVAVVVFAAAVAVAGGGYLVANFEFTVVKEDSGQMAGETVESPSAETAAIESAPTVTETVESPVDETAAEVSPTVAPAVEVTPLVEEPPVVEVAPAVVETVVEAPAVETVAEAAPVVEIAPSELSKWLRRAEVARVENRPEKEIAALQKILELAPGHADARARLRELRAAKKRAEFAAAVEFAQVALDAGDLAAAAQHIHAAATVAPGHEALQPLRSQLRSARAAREFNAQLALGAQAGRQDDWQAALAHFTRARAIMPNDSAAVAGHGRAQAVVDAARRVAGYLAAPQRLADRRVVDSASAYLAAVEPLTLHSAKLKSAHAELADMVAAYLAEVEVTVVSDGKSDIIVRGVGEVGDGKVERRAIKLRPGRRVFECKRRGYQSKIVPLDIAPGAPGPFEVTIVCDQKI